MNNLNWKEFSGSGGGGGGSTEWINSVKSILNTEPGFPTNGDRYILGSSPTGANWSSLQTGLVVEWDSTLSVWESTTPTDGMSVVVDNEDGSIYKYETQGGLNPFPLGVWQKERLGQIRDLTVTTTNGLSFSSTSSPTFSNYVKDMIFLSKFSSTNLGNTCSLNINGIGQVYIKKPTSSGLNNLNPFDIEVGVVYNMVYDGTYFQLQRPFVNEDIFNVKYYVEPTDYIVVPPYYQYWVYGDLTVDGNLLNYGHVIIANGSLVLSGGTFSNVGSGQLVLLSLATGATTSYNETETIKFTYETSIIGPSVSAVVKDGSLTASKLDTGLNGGPTAGYFLSVDTNGDFNWISISTGENTFDDKNFTMTQSSVGDNFFTGLTISHIPVGYVTVFINGVETDIGYGTTNSSSCYFSSDGGLTAKTQNNIIEGDGLYWNNSIAGFELSTDLPDRISLNYLF
jgi:hypothetical protein